MEKGTCLGVFHLGGEIEKGIGLNSAHIGLDALQPPDRAGESRRFQLSQFALIFLEEVCFLVAKVQIILDLLVVQGFIEIFEIPQHLGGVEFGIALC